MEAMNEQDRAASGNLLRDFVHLGRCFGELAIMGLQEVYNKAGAAMDDAMDVFPTDD